MRSLFVKILAIQFLRDDSVGSYEASFHSKAVIHIYAKSTHCNEKLKQPPNRGFRKHLLMVIFIFLYRLSLASLSLFLLKQSVKQGPEEPDARVGQISPHCEKLIVHKLTACNLFQNKYFKWFFKADFTWQT